MPITDHKSSAPVGKQSFIKRFFLGLKSGQASKNVISFRYVYWVDDSWFIGFLADYSDYWTQGATLEELKENLTDIYNQVNDPEAFPSGSVHNELSLDDVPEDHKTDELLIEM